ncbi:MAG TPA: type I 3-dehydroquinate dehydratase [Lachnospiraceae bacterium]|nr:type I 3-dehydroquinate dehydratase [Lachnospiraceae bacterium]
MMNNVVKAGSLLLGDGIPKICVPIIESNHEDILKMAKIIYKSDADMVEWRVDFYKDFHNIDIVNKTLMCIKEILKEKPLLFTFRTAHEGGQEDISYEEYSVLLKEAAVNADIADIEVYRSKNTSKLISYVKKSAVVIGSYHDFNQTPGTDEIIDRLKYMVSAGADIPKIAVMPGCRMDVIRLMEASLKARQILGKPVITMSMADTGLISRAAAEFTCSAVTFGCIGRPSAPGQIEAGTLRKIMNILHSNQERK